MRRKIYFIHFESVWSYPIDEAIKLCEHVIKTYYIEDYYLNDKFRIKRKISSAIKPYPSYIGKNRVYNCLDWDVDDWKELLETLTNFD